MSKIIAGMTMSLDGFISDEYGNINCLYEDLEALRDAPYMQEAIDETGAVIMGKRTYELGDPTLYADHYEFQVPIFIVTNHIPDVLPNQNDLLTFTFVTDGLLSTVNQAKAAAIDKAVQVVGGVDVINQLLQAGLVDELTIDIMPIFLGKGKRLFTDETLEGIKLEKTKCSEEGKRTTIRFKVL